MKHIEALQHLIDWEIAINHKRVDKIKELFANAFDTNCFSCDAAQTSELVRLQSLAIELL